ncbi:SgrR family transcriptional regulator [Paenibacillus vulneris]|uniref:ABC transporter substrate-binding protein n=1 Tax=Paenibacillus vulneris TaxID=1133364 RepID=A0ABW3UMT0_9BACL|nr:ABC transporter substrate-binding protein [Paenibacillus sp. 32352]
MLEYYYLTLRKHLPSAQDKEEIEITLPQLTEWLHCSSRNVNLILKKMEEHNWIQWLPGRGRGHRSRIVFRMTCESLVLQMAQDHVRKGDLQKAFACIDEHGYLPTLRDQFVFWLDSHFGYRPEGNDEDRTDTLRIPYNKPIQCLDPPFITFVVESHMAKQIFDNLVRYNRQTKTIEPHLAHYWTRNETGTDWMFYLRKGVLFHHGREMTAHDVKFTLDRIRCEEIDSPYRWMFECVDKIEVCARYAVRIRLSRPNALFLHCLSFDRASVVPEDLVLSLGDAFQRTPVGTGPFQVVQHDNNMLVCEAFARYFDKRAHLDRIEIWYTPEVECKANWIERTMYRIRTQSGEESQEQKTNVEIRSDGCSKMLTFNLKLKGPQQQLSFRQAVMHGIDRSRSELLPSPEDAYLADWFVPREHVSRQDTLYNPELAKRLLQESGYQGEMIRLAVSKANLGEAEAIQRMLGTMGIRVELNIFGDNYRQRIEAVEKSHLCFYVIILDDDLVLSILELFLAENSFVRRHLSDELFGELKQIIHQLYSHESECGSEGHMEWINQLEQLVKKNAAVYFMYHWRQRTYYHPSLRGVALNALGWVSFRDVWFEPVAGK